MPNVNYPPPPTTPTPKKQTTSTSTIKCCAKPEEVFSVAMALTILFATNLNKVELETLVNILGILATNLSGVITQIEICEGYPVEEVEPLI